MQWNCMSALEWLEYTALGIAAYQCGCAGVWSSIQIRWGWVCYRTSLYKEIGDDCIGQRDFEDVICQLSITSFDGTTLNFLWSCCFERANPGEGLPHTVCSHMQIPFIWGRLVLITCTLFNQYSHFTSLMPFDFLLAGKLLSPWIRV